MTPDKTTNPLKLDDALARDLISGVQTTLVMMFGVQANPGTLVYEKEAFVIGDVSGIVGMVQEKNEAVLVLSFKKETIFFIVSKMYKRPFQEIDKTIRDCVGELSNIIYGTLKKALNSRGYFFKPAIPNVVVGNDHTISNVFTGQSLVIPFTTEAGQFFIQITVQPE